MPGLKILLMVLGLVAAGPRVTDTNANPSLWHIAPAPEKGQPGEIYLLGSVHVLPPQVRWRTRAIEKAIARADVFVFEVPQDETALAELKSLVETKGYLPPDRHLRDLIEPGYKTAFDAALTASGVAPDQVDRDKPWLAGLQLMFAQIAKLHYSSENGVEATLTAHAHAAGKPLRYLETIAQQFAILAPDDPKLQLEEFESGLADLRDIKAEIAPMLSAWGAGDQVALDKVLNGDMDKFPAARKVLLDDRNGRWVPQIAAMLREDKVFLVTVGAGHLTGPGGVPQLLRKAGYTVGGP